MQMRPTLLFSTIWQFKFVKLRLLWKRLGSSTGAPRLARPPRFCLDFGFQYALIRNNWSKKFGVEYWAFPGSNSPTVNDLNCDEP